MAHKRDTCYRDLADTGEIRLLRLHGGSLADEINCSIEHVCLKSCPSYEALSYVWGDPDRQLPINVDGTIRLIGTNLHSALTHVRHERQDRLLWIDTLSINQSDSVERNHQVSQMGRIYGLATRVVVWLGPADASSSLAMPFLSWFFSNSTSSGIASTHRNNSQKDDLLEWYAVVHLCRRRYWSRLWVIQEIVLAKEILLQCGNDWCHWDAFEFYVRLFVQGSILLGSRPQEVAGRPMAQPKPGLHDVLYPYPAEVYKVRDSTVHQLIKERDSIKVKGGRPLLALVLEYDNSRCKDSRDRVFGFHSMAYLYCKDAVPVDYTLDIEKISEMLIMHHSECHNLPRSPRQIRKAFIHPTQKNGSYSPPPCYRYWTCPFLPSTKERDQPWRLTTLDDGTEKCSYCGEHLRETVLNESPSLDSEERDPGFLNNPVTESLEWLSQVPLAEKAESHILERHQLNNFHGEIVFSNKECFWQHMWSMHAATQWEWTERLEDACVSLIQDEEPIP